MAIGVALSAWAMPALSFLGFWDSYLSAALYSGNTLQGVIVISQASITALPKVINRNTWQQTAPAFIDLNRWSYDELNVPAYPAERVLRLVALRACRAYLRAPGGTLLLLGRPDWLNGRRARTAYECAGQVPGMGFLPRSGFEPHQAQPLALVARLAGPGARRILSHGHGPLWRTETPRAAASQALL